MLLAFSRVNQVLCSNAEMMGIKSLCKQEGKTHHRHHKTVILESRTTAEHLLTVVPGDQSLADKTREYCGHDRWCLRPTPLLRGRVNSGNRTCRHTCGNIHHKVHSLFLPRRPRGDRRAFPVEKIPPYARSSWIINSNVSMQVEYT